MALEAPNYFDEAGFARMRTPSKPYDPKLDYSRIIAQLTESIREHGYLGISPQNLVEPAELLPVIVMPYYDKPLRAFVDPQIVEWKGYREQIEGCANIYLIRGRKRLTVAYKVPRAQHVVLSHVVEGKRVTKTYHDKRPLTSTSPCTVGIIFHEVQHTNGKLLADIAHFLFLKQQEKCTQQINVLPELEKEIRLLYDVQSPRVLMRDGDGYVLRLLSEFDGEEVPPVSPDALFADFFYRAMEDLKQTFVPRDGELLPIKASNALYALYADR